MKLGFLTQNNLFAETLILKQELAGTYDIHDDFVQGQIVSYNVKGSVSAHTGRGRTNTVTGQRSVDIISICFNRAHILSEIREGSFPKKGDIIFYNKNNYRITSTQDFVFHDFIDVIATILTGENN